MPFETTPRTGLASSVRPVPGMKVPIGREYADHAGPRVGRAADDLQHALAGIDLADAELVGVGVLLGLDDAGDREGLELRRRILDAFDLEADGGERIGELLDGRVRLEMIAEPGEGEFHGRCPF